MTKVLEYLKGVINLRGEVIPVMRLRIKMYMESDDITKDTRIIIIKINHDGIGLMVDSVKEVVSLNVAEIEKVSFENREERNTFVQGIGKQGEALISLLDINAVLQEA